MRNQLLRQRLKSKTNTQLAQSLIILNPNPNPNQRSIIHQLGDFLTQQFTDNDHINNVNSNQSNNHYHNYNHNSNNNLLFESPQKNNVNSFHSLGLNSFGGGGTGVGTGGTLRRYCSGNKKINASGYVGGCYGCIGKNCYHNNTNMINNTNTTNNTSNNNTNINNSYQYGQFATQRSRKTLQYNPSSEHISDALFHKNRNKQKCINNNANSINGNNSGSNKKRFFQLDQKQSQQLSNNSTLLQPQSPPQNTQITCPSTTKTKQSYNRSQVTKTKPYIYSKLLKKCQNCHQPKSQIFYNNFMCSNKKCQLLHHLYDNLQTFSVGALLFQAEFPSASIEEIEGLSKLVQDQIWKIQKIRSELIEMQFYIGGILSDKKLLEKNQKNNVKDLLNSICQTKYKKYQLQSQSHHQQQHQHTTKLQSIDFTPVYQQFSKWHKLVPHLHTNPHPYLSPTYKTITELINKYKPLSLKQLTSQLSQQIASISDNFKGMQIVVRSSIGLEYNFCGNLDKMKIYVDGSMQDKLKRDNFLLIEKVEQLQLIFQSRKTSLQLRQLFNILPACNYLKITFDYKLNSHVNSQTFPLLTKSLELAQKALQLHIMNARPQIFQDLIQATKLANPNSTLNSNQNLNSNSNSNNATQRPKQKQKSKICITIQLNPYIYMNENQFPQFSKSVQEGTKLVKNLLKNCGNKLTSIKLDLPLRIDVGAICQFLINQDYYLLTEFVIKDSGKSVQKENIQKLLQKIINKKKMLLKFLMDQKKDSFNLSKYPLLTQSVYKLLN